MKSKLLTISLITLLACSNIFAKSISFSFENDVFDKLAKPHSDDDYSNGVRLEYLMDNDFGFAIGQSMYTPSDLTIKENQPGTRQYAGYLYLEENYRRTDTEVCAIQVGFIGKNSLAKETQKTIHKWINSRDPQGWSNQIEGHGIELQAYYKWMYHLIKSDFFYLCPAMTLSGGMVDAMATPGIFGYFCFNHVPSYRTGLPVTEIRGLDKNFTSWIPSVYLFIGAECDCVAYNYFLDAHESDVDKEYFVGEFSTGIGFQLKNVFTKFTYIVKTKEYEEQKHPANFGALTIGYTF